ncbi:hypothetical protein ACHAXN_010203 [Cyclotella atomus]
MLFSFSIRLECDRILINTFTCTLGLFFLTSREACCERFYRWDKATCLGEAAATPPGFYPNWGYPEQKVSCAVFTRMYKPGSSDQCSL